MRRSPAGSQRRRRRLPALVSSSSLSNDVGVHGWSSWSTWSCVAVDTIWGAMRGVMRQRQLSCFAITPLVAESSLLCGGSSPAPRRLPYSAGSSPTPQRLPYTTSSSFAPLRVSCSTTAPHLPHNISPYLLAPSLPCAGSQARWARRRGPNVGDSHEDPLNNQGKPA
jgi:hypothetical protein